MKKAVVDFCRLNVDFKRYTEMIDLVDYLFSVNPDLLIDKLERDLVDLKGIQLSLKDCLKQCERQINFVENFLDDCGVNPYEK